LIRISHLFTSIISYYKGKKFDEKYLQNPIFDRSTIIAKGKPFQDHPEFLQVIPKGKKTENIDPSAISNTTRVKYIHFTRDMLDRLKLEVTESLPEEGNTIHL
jgi:hypothetical protein